jgi:hypothetical protein
MMVKQERLWSVALASVALALGVASAAGAATFTLDQLINGTVRSFQSDNGLLTFSDFSLGKFKKLSGNLSLYTVTTVGDGFVLSSSAFTASSGGIKRLNFEYKVTANSGSITGAEMVMDATRDTGRVQVFKDIEDPKGDEGTFLATLLQRNVSSLSDSDTFSPGVKAFEVEESIRIKKVATLNSVRNSYTVSVPEPAELSLLAAGITGLAVFGRRRSATRID